MLLFWLGVVLPGANAATFTATYDRNPIPVGESAMLLLTFTGGSPNTVPGVQPTGGLTLGYSEQSQEISIVNGRTSRNLTFSYSVAASQPGDFTLPPIRAEVDGQVLTAQPPALKVLPRGAPSPEEDRIRGMAFLKMLQPKKQVYVGELFPVEMQLDVQNGKDVQMPQLRSEGFTFSKTAQPTQSRVQIQGAIYNLVVFRMSALAAKAGNLILGPATCDLNLLIAPTRHDPFDLFGARYQLKHTTLTSELHPIQVLPLPQDSVPDDFTGAVGNFTSLTVNAAPTDVAVGDPITIKIQIAGQGGLDSLALP
ncbi:MAG: BatD family protein, partial [Pedosphaera parvula]|nr:BatD family protein [Pedosphaera parvula]